MSACVTDGSDESGASPAQMSLFGDAPEALAQVKGLEDEIVDLHTQQELCERETKELARREMAGEGSFASRIHALKQRKMVLITEAQHRKVRINWLRMGF